MSTDGAGHLLAAAGCLVEYIDVVGTATVLPPVSKTQIITLAVRLERSARIGAVATETLETGLYKLRQ